MNYWRQYSHQVVTSGHFEKAGLKQKAIHEFSEFVGIFLYLAFFFGAITTYKMLLQSDFRDSYISYSFSAINALVIAKVIHSWSNHKVQTTLRMRFEGTDPASRVTGQAELAGRAMTLSGTIGNSGRKEVSSRGHIVNSTRRTFPHLNWHSK